MWALQKIKIKKKGWDPVKSIWRDSIFSYRRRWKNNNNSTRVYGENDSILFFTYFYRLRAIFSYPTAVTGIPRVYGTHDNRGRTAVSCVYTPETETVTRVRWEKVTVRVVKVAAVKPSEWDVQILKYYALLQGHQEKKNGGE